MLKISQHTVKELFTYKDGDLIWNVNRGFNKTKNKKAGNINSKGYFQISIDKRLYKTHRLVYIYHYGEIKENYVIDHINRVKTDNRIENLRMITEYENRLNSGAVGVSMHKSTGKYESRIKVNKKNIYLGVFKNKEDAIIAYKNAKKEFHKISSNEWVYKGTITSPVRFCL